MKPLPMFDDDRGNYKPKTLRHNMRVGNDLHLQDLCAESGIPYTPCGPQQIIAPIAFDPDTQVIKKEIVPLPIFPPLPQPNPKSVEERVAEAETFRGELPEYRVKEIIENIRGSARDFGEPSFYVRPEDQEEPSPGNHIITNIQIIVSRHFHITRREMVSGTQIASIVRPRQVAMYLSRVMTDCSFSVISQKFDGRDHTTVINAMKKITALIETDAELAEDIAVLKEMVLG